MNWKTQAADSHYRTAVAIRDHLGAGQVAEAATGLEELIDALSRSERRALKSQLIRLMKHVLKWLSEPEQRSRSWAASIRSARREIRDIQAETPSLSDEVVRAMWDDCLEAAKDEAEAEMNQPVAVPQVSWDDVFTTSFRE
jgi:hypothetical protein